MMKIVLWMWENLNWGSIVGEEEFTVQRFTCKSVPVYGDMA
jgi:hypothetical protein